ncbi:hypothetical protein E0Z10_g8534 [Xylaria hypoxylon]|uniref:T cell CD4 receptor C-terminal region domain-containing protein n=1 Tax=Xylaria hypoxylon TaxID=37992 RepID=A0A4Z0YLA3_9PEZI|nr:hypothetical protein E0Z10_g8534 [Xylaria hypoxylon]
MPGLRISARADEPAGVVPIDAELSADESSDGESSDDEFSDGELSDDEDSDDEGSVKVPSASSSAPLSTTLGPGTTTTPILSGSTTVANPATTLLTTTSQPSKATTTTSSQSEVSDVSSISLLPDSSAPTSSKSIPIMSTLVPSSTVIPIASTSPIPVTIPGYATIPTSVLSQITSDGQFGDTTSVPQADTSVNPPDESGGSASNNSQRAGQIAGGTIGGIAFIGLVIFAIWMWRRRRGEAKRLSRLSDDMQYPTTQPRGLPSRTPSSIMNQLITAAYAAEDGANYRNSEQIFDNYANEKQGITTHKSESTERLTVPASAQLRPPSIAARTETTDRTESTWKTWGVLAGSSRVSVPRNWWVDRYLRT